MINAKIIRLEESDYGALGVLVLDERILAITLEPDSADDVRFQVPSGEYMCKRFHGQKWPDTFEIPVEGHVAILFHAGNIEKHTRGCVILGRYVGYLKGHRAVLNSGWTFKEFMIYLKDEDEFHLSIINAYGSVKFKKKENHYDRNISSSGNTVEVVQNHS